MNNRFYRLRKSPISYWNICREHAAYNIREMYAHEYHKKVSHAVQKDNYALRMYQKAGFKIIDETMEEFIMEYLF